MALFFFTGLGRVFSQILLGSHLLGVSGRSTSVGTELQDLQQLVQLGTGSQAHWPRARQLPGTEPQYRGVISYLTLPSLPGTMVPLELPTTVSTCAQASLGFRTRAFGAAFRGWAPCKKFHSFSFFSFPFVFSLSTLALSWRDAQQKPHCDNGTCAIGRHKSLPKLSSTKLNQLGSFHITFPATSFPPSLSYCTYLYLTLPTLTLLALLYSTYITYENPRRGDALARIYRGTRGTYYNTRSPGLTHTHSRTNSTWAMRITYLILIG